MRSATLTLPWADGDYVFRLAWGQLCTLQEECDAGPYVILGRLTDGTWKMKDISSTIRLGLIGGGMPPVEALQKVRLYVESEPPYSNLALAQAILGAGVVGAADEPIEPKKETAANPEEELTTSQTESSDLPLFTGLEQS